MTLNFPVEPQVFACCQRRLPLRDGEMRPASISRASEIVLQAESRSHDHAIADDGCLHWRKQCALLCACSSERASELANPLIFAQVPNLDWTSPKMSPITHASKPPPPRLTACRRLGAVIAFITGWSATTAPGVSTCGGASLWSPLPSYPSLVPVCTRRLQARVHLCGAQVTSACGFSAGSVPGCSAMQSCVTSGGSAVRRRAGGAPL